VPQLSAAVNARFSPDGDSSQDSVTIKANADAATSFLRLRITRAGKIVWARLAPVAQAGEYTFVWDGGDVTGRIVADGMYGYAIEAVNRAGVASAALRGYVEVDGVERMVSVRREQ
jgi:flagellar hook assembly protein FlgD